MTKEIRPTTELREATENELEQFEVALPSHDKAVAYPDSIEVRKLPGGTMLEMEPKERFNHLNRLAEDAEYMKDRFRSEGALLGEIDNALLVVDPTSPHGENHLTVFQVPPKERFGIIMGSFTTLSPAEQEKFIRFNLIIRDQLSEEFTDSKFIIGVNRSARPKLEEKDKEWRLVTGSQSVPILHSHIVEGPKQQKSFGDKYNPKTSSRDGLNKKMLELRTTHITEQLQSQLKGVLQEGSADLAGTKDLINITYSNGRYLEIQLSDDFDTMMQEIRHAVWSAEEMFEDLEWGQVYDALPPVLRDSNAKFGYAWAITSDNCLRIGFTPHDTGYLELFNVVLDRSLSKGTNNNEMRRKQKKEIVQTLITSLTNDEPNKQS